MLFPFIIKFIRRSISSFSAQTNSKSPISLFEKILEIATSLESLDFRFKTSPSSVISWTRPIQSSTTLNPVQTENNPYEVKQLFGDRLTINGGFDNVAVLDNPDATEQDIRDSINKTLYEMYPGGG